MRRSAFILISGWKLLWLTTLRAGATQRIAITISSEDNSLRRKRRSDYWIACLEKSLPATNFKWSIKAAGRRDRRTNLLNSDYADPKTAAALGRIVGASRILNVSASLEVDNNTGALVSNREADVSASFQLVGVDTTQRIIAAGTADGTGQRRAGDGSDTRIVNQAIDDCADDLAEQIEAAG